MAKKDTKIKQTDKKTVVARVIPATYKRLKGICKKEGLTMDALLNERIDNWLKTQKARATSRAK